MFTYVLRRLFWAVPTLFGVSLLVFSMVHMVPGDPAVVIVSERGFPGSTRKPNPKLSSWDRSASGNPGEVLWVKPGLMDRSKPRIRGSRTEPRNGSLSHWR